MIRMITDCGTTNLRVTLVDESGSIRSAAKRPGGVRHTAIDGHNQRLRVLLREAMDEALTAAGIAWADVNDCCAYGMITSNVGLLEIPHIAAPASAKELRRGMRSALFEDIAPMPIRFIPGVRNFADSVNLENFSGMDMMRGEETEAVGLWKLLRPERESLFILPGTHNKFVRMSAEGSILGCMTSISGELLDALTHHTLLTDTVGGAFADAEHYDSDFALRGARECRSSGLGRAAFAGRILNQLGGIPKEKLRSWLLGAVLAQDALALQSFAPGLSEISVYVAGKQPLRRAFADVMSDDAQIIEVPPEVSERMGIEGVTAIVGA